MNPADNQNNFNPAPVAPDPIGAVPPAPSFQGGFPSQDSSDQDSSPFASPPPMPMESTSPSTVPLVPTSPSTLPQTPPLPSDQTTEVVTQSSSGGSGSKKKILAALGIVIMLFGIGAGVYAFRNYQAGSASAWDCSLYTFNIDDNGTVTVQNGSDRNEPLQKADVYINGTLVQTFDVPALTPGQGTTLGVVSLPVNQSYTWRVDGTVDCENSGSKQVDTVSAECSNVIAYDENWVALTPSALSQLEEGDVVRFAVFGTASEGTFDMARFSVNGAAAVEVTDLKPSSQEFYYEYTIPEDEDTFNVSAEIHHSELGWF